MIRTLGSKSDFWTAIVSVWMVLVEKSQDVILFVNETRAHVTSFTVFATPYWRYFVCFHIINPNNELEH